MDRRVHVVEAPLVGGQGAVRWRNHSRGARGPGLGACRFDVRHEAAWKARSRPRTTPTPTDRAWPARRRRRGGASRRCACPRGRAGGEAARIAVEPSRHAVEVDCLLQTRPAAAWRRIASAPVEGPRRRGVELVRVALLLLHDLGEAGPDHAAASTARYRHLRPSARAREPSRNWSGRRWNGHRYHHAALVPVPSGLIGRRASPRGR